MATISDFPFDPGANPTWNDVITSTVPGFGSQTYAPVLDSLKTDSSIIIDPLLVPQQIGAVWSNTVDTFMRVSWPAIVSVLVGASGNSFLALDDVDETTYTGKTGYLVRVNSNPDGLEFAETIDVVQVLDGVTDGDGTKRFLTDTDVSNLDDDIESREPLTTGVLTWGAPGLSLFDTSTVTIEAGTGTQITRSGLATTRTDVSWIQQNLAILNIGTRIVTFLTMDTGGTAQQYTSVPDAATLANEIFLGVIIHDGGDLDRVIVVPRVIADLAKLVRDEISATGPVKISNGGDVDEKASFTSIRRLTDIFVAGINFVNSALEPNIISYAEQDPMIFDAVFEDGTVNLPDTTVYQKVYESAPGVLTALSGQQAVIHKIIMLADGTHQVQYGDVTYSNFSAAKDAINEDLTQTTFNPLAKFMGKLLAVAVIGNGASDWTTNGAEIIQFVGTGGGGGTGGTPALGDLTDVTISTPAEGHVIYYNSGSQVWNNGKESAQFIFSFVGNITAPTSDIGPKAYVYAREFKPERVRIDVKTAPVSTDLEIDVKKNGTSIFSDVTKVVISTSGFTGSKVPDQGGNFLQDDAITIDVVDGDGDWQDLTVSLQGSSYPG